MSKEKPKEKPPQISNVKKLLKDKSSVRKAMLLQMILTKFSDKH